MPKENYDFHPERKTIENLLRASVVYEVPDYQRGYSWTADSEVETFWGDLTGAWESKRSYFFGSMVFSDEGDDKLCIIDGQQRLATCIILLACIRDIVDGLGDYKKAGNIHRDIEGSDYSEQHKTYKLVLNEDDRTFFRSHILMRTMDDQRVSFSEFARKKRTEKKLSNQRLFEAYELLKAKLEALVKDKDKAQAADHLCKLAQFLTQNFVVISIHVASEINAYIIFETINDRRLELSVSDLLKNYLLSRAAKSTREEIKSHWKEIANVIDTERIPKFLRHYWMSKHEAVTEKELYRVMKSDLMKEDIPAFVLELKNESEWYDAMLNPDSDIWILPEISEALNNLKALGASQCYPLLLAARDCLSDKKFAGLVKFCEIFTFRYSTICRKNPNILESLYCDCALEFRKKRLEAWQQVLRKMRDACPSDDEFRSTFPKRQLETKVSTTGRYLLEKINYHETTHEEVAAGTSRVNVEHILPLSLSSEWLDYWSKQHKDEKESYDPEEYKHRIGNLTLLGGPLNRKNSNSLFEKKRVKYSESSFAMTHSLCDKKYWKQLADLLPEKKQQDRIKDGSNWNRLAIEARQIEFANKALEIWNIDGLQKLLLDPRSS